MDPGGKDFRSRTLAGVGWSAFAQVARQVLVFALGVLLARLLTPRAFGLLSMVLVFVGFADVFRDMGFRAALVQKRDVEERHESSVFWLNAALGALLTLLFVALAPAVAAFYGEPALAPLTAVIALKFFLDSLGIVQHARFTRRLDFRLLAVLELTAVGLSGALAVGLALAGFGVWSLAAQYLALAALSTALLWWAGGWRPRFTFEAAAVRELLGFSGNLLGFSVLNYASRNADNLLVGRFLGSAALGLYSRAYAVLLYPLNNISGTISRVMFPAMSSIQGDVPRVRRLYLRVVGVIALLTFPMMLGLLAVAESFVLGLFGIQWAGMIPIVRVFCLASLVQSIVTLNGTIYMALGRTDLQLRVGGTIGVLSVGAIAAGLPWGVVGVAVSYTLYSLLVVYPHLRVAGSLLGLTFGDVARHLAGIFACAAVMAVGVCGLGRALPPAWPHAPRLALLVAAGMVLYAALIHFARLPAYGDVRQLLAERLGGPGV